jgi:transcriptional regulator of acetoin/glycerol metabolism
MICDQDHREDATVLIMIDRACTVLASSRFCARCIKSGRAVEAMRALASVSPRTLKEIHDEAIENALEKYRGNFGDAARELGVSRATIYRHRKRSAPQ